jgi:hypothetical protein
MLESIMIGGVTFPRHCGLINHINCQINTAPVAGIVWYGRDCRYAWFSGGIVRSDSLPENLQSALLSGTVPK